jgi:hypothetical protein
VVFYLLRAHREMLSRKKSGFRARRSEFKSQVPPQQPWPIWVETCHVNMIGNAVLHFCKNVAKMKHDYQHKNVQVHSITCQVCESISAAFELNLKLYLVWSFVYL